MEVINKSKKSIVPTNGNRRLNKFINTISLVIGMCILIPGPVCRAQNSKATITFYATYDDSLSVQTGDYFQIVLKNLENDKEQELSLDASKAIGEGIHFSLPMGEYRIIEFDYQGYNTDIEKEGYGITSLFTVNPEYTGVEISVGTSSSQSLQAQYSEVLLRQEEEYINELISEDSPIGPEETTEDNIIIESQKHMEDDVKKDYLSDKESITDVEQEKQKVDVDDSVAKKTNYFITLLPIIIVALIGFIIIYYIHKKKIL